MTNRKLIRPESDLRKESQSRSVRRKQAPPESLGRWRRARLLEQGSEPGAAVVMLSAAQLASDRVRGGYSAFFLLQLSDIVPAGRRGDLSPTEISQLFFARVSAYYARREGIRQFVGSQLLPNYAGFSDVISRRAPGVEEPDAAELRVVMESRLAELGALCAEHGLRCIFAVPPGLRPYRRPGLVA